MLTTNGPPRRLDLLSQDVLTRHMDEINKTFIVPFVSDEKNQSDMRQGILNVIGEGKHWLFNKEDKKQIREFRKDLDTALNTWNKSYRVLGISGGYEYGMYVLHNLFRGGRSLEPDGKGTMDSIKDMIARCDAVLGVKEPARYPRQKIITDTLKIWQEYTGQPIPPGASRENEILERGNGETRKKRSDPTPSYELCRLVLEAIEGKFPGDISGIYNRIAKSKTFQKKPS